MEEKWLTVEEVCKYLQVGKDTVYKWIKEKGMPSHRVGKRWMFQKSDIDQWIKSGEAR